MIRLPKAKDAWNSAGFNRVLSSELGTIDAGCLPLQQGLTQSSRVSPEPFKVIVLSSEEIESLIRCRVSVVYAGIVAGCSCSDDPSPVDTLTEYCELLLEIDRVSAETRISLLNADT
jgi:hypothetical protein